MVFDDAERAQILSRLERLQALMTELESVAATVTDRQRVRDRMKHEIEAAKETVRVLGTHDTMGS
jgi:ribosome-associated translation inhibitor RaiA